MSFVNELTEIKRPFAGLQRDTFVFVIVIDCNFLWCSKEWAQIAATTYVVYTNYLRKKWTVFSRYFYKQETVSVDSPFF